MSDETKVELSGVSELARTVSLTQRDTRERTKRVIQRGTEAVRDKAKALVPKRTGELASTIRDEFKDDGMTGLVEVGYGKLPRKSKKRRSGAQRARRTKRGGHGSTPSAVTTAPKPVAVTKQGEYAPIIEYGDQHRNRKAQRFMMRAFLSEKQRIQNELTQAPIDAGRSAGFE